MATDEEKDDELFKLFKKTLGNTKTRKDQLKLIKQVDPDLPIPEVDAEDRVMAVVKQQEDQIKALKEERDHDKVIAGIKEHRETIKSKYKLDDEGLKKVEQLMVDKKIGDHDTAAEFIANNNKLATPTVAEAGFRQVKMPSDEALLKDPIGWARNEAHAEIDRLNGVRR